MTIRVLIFRNNCMTGKESEPRRNGDGDARTSNLIFNLSTFLCSPSSLVIERELVKREMLSVKREKLTWGTSVVFFLLRVK